MKASLLFCPMKSLTKPRSSRRADEQERLKANQKLALAISRRNQELQLTKNGSTLTRQTSSNNSPSHPDTSVASSFDLDVPVEVSLQQFFADDISRFSFDDASMLSEYNSQQERPVIVGFRDNTSVYTRIEM